MSSILVRHEQGATHAADGYARSTGKPGVVLVTSAPDTNGNRYSDGLYGFDPDGDYHRASAPAGHRQRCFQECDTVGITRPA